MNFVRFVTNRFIYKSIDECETNDNEETKCVA